MNKNIEIKILLFYSVSFAVILFILNQLFFPNLLVAQNFLNWDAEHYCWIANYGYKDFRVAFFPLFPMIWKVSHLSIYGIVIFNVLFFLLSFYFLLKTLTVSPLEIILYLSIPSFCFFILPYSESVFFASSTILLIGLKNKKNALILLGLFLSTLARPAFTIFIPALIIAELLCEKIDKKLFLRILMYIVTTLLGLLLVGLIQHYYTGKWFEFFEVQKGWGNKLQMPSFPLTSWAGGLIVRLDGAALLFGTVAGIIMCLYILKAKFMQRITMPKEVVFSLCYLAGISLTVLFFRGGSLFSLNRFVFVVPFIIIAANFYLTQKITFSNKQMIIAFVLINIFWLSFGSYVHIQEFLKFFALSLYLFLLILFKSYKSIIQKTSLILLIIINTIFQFVFLIRFLNGNWVG